MARARNIKPGFFQDDKVGALDPLSRLLFIGMWTIADFKGCIEYRPKMMKLQLLGYDICDIEGLVNDLEQARFIRLYSWCGKRYIKIVNFEKHQNPHKNEREAGSDIPDITVAAQNEIENKDLQKDGSTPDLIGTTRADSLLLIPDSLNPSNTSSSSTKKPPKSDPVPFEKIVDLYHEHLPMCPQVKALTATRKSYIAARWKSGAVPDLDTWRDFFVFVGKSKFLTGMVDPPPGKKRFVADLEWITKESNFIKIYERKYHEQV